MTTNKETGTIEKTILLKIHEEAHIEWTIPDFPKIAETEDAHIRYDSPSFFVIGVSWRLELFLKLALDFEFIRLFITTKVKREYSVEYNLSLKKSDGSAQQLVSGILKDYDIMHDVGNVIKRSELLKQKSEVLHQDALTIICTLKREVSYSTHPTGSDLIMPLKLNRLDKLSENFKDLFGDQETCDVTLKVKDKEYKAHKSVLIARSSVFAATFKHDTLERQTGVITISDCDPDSFQVFLEYLYTGKLEELSVCSALNLYYTSDKYDVDELKTFCVECLTKNLTVEGVCEVAVFADKYDQTALFSAVQDFFNENAGKIFATSEWRCFMKEDDRLASKLLLEMSKVKLKG